MKPLLRSLVPEQLAEISLLQAEPSFRTRQLGRWVYNHRIFTWEQMSNVPSSLRSKLAAVFDLTALEEIAKQTSEDGTRKFLFRLRDGQSVESVIIPMGEHATFCISCQVGCAMACSFCATARGGLIRQLEPGEIVEQVLRLAENLEEEPLEGFGERQYNIVFMGMGEPLDNWENVAASLDVFMHPEGLNISRRRIQVSTSGPAQGLRALIQTNPGIGLTLSLGGTTDSSRKKVMPVPGRTGVEEAVELAADYARISKRRTTLAWVLIEGRTDSLEQADQLAALAKKGSFKVNLIPLNPLEEGGMVPPDAQQQLGFQKVLTDRGIPAFIRSSGGQDIAAACGQLRRKTEKKPRE